MSNLRFDLNDIDNEPSDEALAAIMEDVAAEAQRTEKIALENMLSNLRQALKKAHNPDFTG